METDSEALQKRLKDIEVRYPLLEASISELNAGLSQSPHNQSLQDQLARQKGKLRDGKNEAEELRYELGLPIEEEDTG